MNNNEMPRRKGFSFLSFFLGILLGMLLIIGAIVGVVLYALNGKIDDVMNTVGVPNKDEEGNYIYINTDKDNGGAETILQLISKVGELAGDTSNLSVEKVETLIPAVGGLVDTLCDTLNQYVQIDRAELAATPFSGLGAWVQEQILSVQPASLLDLAGMGGSLDNKIVSLILEGREASYVVNGSQKYPAYYDAYTVSGASYVRSDGQPLPAGLESSLVEKDGEYRLYFFEYNGQNYVTDGTFAFTAPLARSAGGVTYTPSSEAKLSGNYYYDGSEKINVTPITLRDFSDGEFKMLDEVYLTEFLDEGGGALAEKALGDISLGDVVNGRLDLNEALSNLTLADIIENIAVTDAVMVNITYKVSNVTDVQGQSYSHTGVYTKNGGKIDVCIETSASGNVERVYYIDNGSEIDVPATSVKDLMEGLNIDELINEFTLADFIDITPDDTIIAYLAYGIYGINPALKMAFIEVNGVELACTLTTDSNNVITAVTDENGERIFGNSVNEIAGNIDTIVDKMTLNDIMDVSGNSILEKLGDKKISELPEALNDLTVGDVLDTEGNALLEKLKDTKISELGDGINDLTISDIIDTEGNMLLEKLKDTKLSELSEAINNLTLGDVVDVGENKLLIKLQDTKITQLSTAIDDLTLGDVVDAGDNRLLMRLQDTKITELSTAIDDLTIGDVIDTTGNPMLEKLSGSKITELATAIDELTIGDIVRDTQGNKLLERLKDTQIKDLATEVNNLTVGDVMTIDENSFLLSEFTDTKIVDLPNAIGGVTINSLYADNIYSVKDGDGNVVVPAKRKPAATFDERFLYYELTDGGKYELVNGTGKLTSDSFVAGKYYTYGEARGIWKTLLYKDGSEVACTIEHLDELTNNVSNNIGKSTLSDLTEIGILDLTDEQLDKQIYYYDSATMTFKPSAKIGTMPLNELITFVIDKVTTQPSLPSVPIP